MSQISLAETDPKTHIIINNATMHNLKGVSVALPRNKFIVITGLSGSGKSSLAFDTLYAEGQRRYVESLSSYARQFMGKLDKPEVESIKGISPAIAIEQKVVSRNARSTVGTSTEVYDYLKLLFARIGKTISPVSGKEVTRQTVTDVVNFYSSLSEGTKTILLSPLQRKKGRKIQEELEILEKQGFTRLLFQDQILRIEDYKNNSPKEKDELYIVIDRIISKPGNDENDSRIADSVETAYFEGDGRCFIEIIEEGDGKNKKYEFSNRFELDGIVFEKPNVHFFSFNNPVGACKTCEGFGSVIGIDPDAVIPNKSLSIFDNAVASWRGEKMGEWRDELIRNASSLNFPIHRPYFDLTKEQKELLWTGKGRFKGLNAFFRYLESKSYKIQYRVMLSRYRGKTDCPECKGTRLRKDASYVKIDGHSILDLVKLPLEECLELFNNLKLSDYEQKIAQRLLIEMKSRLQYLCDVGLGYLTLNRLSNTLSGGESQRIKLATSLGSSLVGSMYILDEPSIGLHPRDTERLIKVLFSLKKLGNTVIVVEHDEEIMKAADQIIDMGPEAGTHGGELIFQGNHEELLYTQNSLTADYLTGRKEIEVPSKRRKWKDSITVEGARENNLKNLKVEFPLNCLTVITGVSGSGKSTLVKKILYPSVKKLLDGFGDKTGEVDKVTGSFKSVKAIEFIDQNPIGKSSRSNPITYIKAFDDIRTLFAKQKLAKLRNYKPGHFSFNVKGGRCETCEGEGTVKIEMQFMADIELRCESCKGKRYKQETLEIKYREKNIADILDLTVDEAIEFFEADKKDASAAKINEKIIPLQDVGLGYVQLGQSSSTLSGGEAQRIKLASFLTKGTREPHTLFIFDEPTTGLHFHDIQKLLKSFNALINKGHSLIVIEHNVDVIKCADWIIDLGPEGGEKGGYLLHTGTPEDLVGNTKSYTAKYLGEKL